MNKKCPMVSVILPTYNGKKEWISESIESVLNQTFTDFEFIIINDGSTNDIEKTILEYAKKDKRIIYTKNEENLKLTRTLNKGLGIANGKYIARADDDIWANKTQLQQQIDFMEKNPEYGIVGTNAEIIDESGNFLYIINRPGTDKELRENMIVGNWFIHSSIVIRKEILDKIGGYNPKWNMVEDYELRLRIGKISKMKNLLDVKSIVRVNTHSVTRGNYKKQKWMTLKLFFKYMKYYPKKYFLKGFLFYLWGLIIPEKWTKYILKKCRTFNII